MEFPKILNKINRILGLISGAIILIIGILTSMEGIARGLFDQPTTWSLDVCRYLLIWAVFLSSSFAFQEKAHVSVDFFREGIGKKTIPVLQRVMAILGYIFSLVYILIIVWGGLYMFVHGLKWERLTRGTIQIPIIWVYWAVVIGSVMMAITVIAILINLIRGKNDYI
jgi:C4-dicarboxylate transporter DctQ subunit